MDGRTVDWLAFGIFERRWPLPPPICGMRKWFSSLGGGVVGMFNSIVGLGAAKGMEVSNNNLGCKADIERVSDAAEQRSV